MSALGRVSLDYPGAFLSLTTGFVKFESPTGCGGLARDEGDTLHILAIMATKPGTGQFRAFLRACQQEYRVIAIWEIWNARLDATLDRYGFREVVGQLDGDLLIGRRWERV